MLIAFISVYMYTGSSKQRRPFRFVTDVAPAFDNWNRRVFRDGKGFVGFFPLYCGGFYVYPSIWVSLVESYSCDYSCIPVGICAVLWLSWDITRPSPSHFQALPLHRSQPLKRSLLFDIASGNLHWRSRCRRELETFARRIYASS